LTQHSPVLALAHQRQSVFFGGKGGVGKTTVSAGTAIALAESGKRVLLVSTDPAHNLGHLFERKLGPEPTRIAANLDAIELDPQQTINQHLREVGSALRRLMPAQFADEVDKHMTLSRDAPGMEEAALLERVAELIEDASRNYDLIIFDTAPSGHTARLMALPEMMSAWTEGLLKRRDKSDRLNKMLRELGNDKSHGDKLFGGNDNDAPVDGDSREQKIRQILNRRRQRFHNLRKALADHQRTTFVIVLAAERLPVLETIELYARLEKTSVNIGALVVNKRLPADENPFMSERRKHEELQLHTLQKAVPKVLRQDLELFAHDVVGLNLLQQFSKIL